MTRFAGGPYLHVVIRILAASLSVVCTACATDSVSHAELNELMASVRAMRADNARLEARLEHLEQQTVTSTRKVNGAASVMTSAAPAHVVAAAPASVETPSLTVVKLKPRTQSAPRLSTHIEVTEPAEAVVDDLKGDHADEADAALIEAAYARGVDALKTGNAETGVAQLLQFVSDNPRHAHADNALYFVGVAQMAQQDFGGAAQQFERVTQQYPAGDSVVDSMLKLGDCRLRMKQPQLARATWEKLVASFPGTPGASQAQARLATLSSSTP